MGFFPVDEATVDYLAATGRTDAEIDAFARVLQGAGPVRHAARRRDRLHAGARARPRASIRPVGRRARSARRIASSSRRASKADVRPTLLRAQPGRATTASRRHAGRRARRKRVPPRRSTAADASIGNGDVLIAAITSCTNTSNPGVLLAAGLLAKKAVERGPDRQAARQDLARARLARRHRLPDQARACCPTSSSWASASPPTAARPASATPATSTPEINEAIIGNDLVCAARALGQPQLRGAHPPEPQGQLPRVAAAGRRLRHRRHRAASTSTTEPLGTGTRRQAGLPARHLADVARDRRGAAVRAATRRPSAGSTATSPTPTRCGTTIPAPPGRSTTGRRRPTSPSRRSSTASRWTPAASRDIRGARALGIFGDSVTTDHISPGRLDQGRLRRPAASCVAHGVARADFNSYGSRRGNHEVMMRGTFANVRIKNLMLPPRADGTREEGGVTLLQPARREDVDLRRGDALRRARARRRSSSPARSTAPAARATGRPRARSCSASRRSSRRASSASTAPTWSAWACCRCQFKDGDSAQSLGLDGDETFDIVGLEADIRPQQDLTLAIHRADGSAQQVPVLLRIDTPIEVDYYHHGGILPSCCASSSAGGVDGATVGERGAPRRPTVAAPPAGARAAMPTRPPHPLRHALPLFLARGLLPLRRSTRRRSGCVRDHSLLLVVWARYAGADAGRHAVRPAPRRAGLLAHRGDLRTAARCARRCLLAATVCFFGGLRYLPLAEALGDHASSRRSSSSCCRGRCSANGRRARAGSRDHRLRRRAGRCCGPGSAVLHPAALLLIGTALCQRALPAC